MDPCGRRHHAQNRLRRIPRPRPLERPARHPRLRLRIHRPQRLGSRSRLGSQNPPVDHLFWATTIPGRFPGTENAGDNAYNHRIYAVTTPDFKTFTEPRLYFDPGFNSIDFTLVHDRRRWIMIFLDHDLQG